MLRLVQNIHATPQLVRIQEVRPAAISMKNPAAYTITETLYEERGTILYRALRNVDSRPVVLKVLVPRFCRPKDMERLKSEYAIGKTLAMGSVVEPLELETYHGMPALVMEDFGGQLLARLLGEPMEIGAFLDLAIRITAAVADIHHKGIVHKDLKPQNILVNLTTHEVKIADFGLATSLPREEQPARPPRLIEGSLPYMSPEQTGRMNRAIDSRTDLYSLGVTFYQMLTARLPFEASDPVEWVYRHIAYTPISPSLIVPAVPEAISRIVIKLLAKMPEDRYQNARGLLHDLEKCLASLVSDGRIEPFALGERDASDRLQVPQKLYGRDAESALLLEAFGRMLSTGIPELLLVFGTPGIGKTSLVHELHKPITRERAFFVSGKFDQYNRDIPYATIVQAFRELVLEILAESEEQIALWRRRLEDALGINAQLIVDVIPQVELVIGRKSPVPVLSAAEAKNRFRIVFRRFIGVFARREHPLALFLDDLQWADSASLELLQDLMTHPETRYVLIIGACRDSELTPSHPLMLTLDEIRKVSARISRILLGPLSNPHLTTLISDTFRCPRESAAPLGALVHDKTAGNPFFAIQFLSALHEEYLIVFDESAGVWRWDITKIREKGYTDNVVDLMVDKLKKLPPDTRKALKLLSCLGSRVDVATLSLTRGRPEKQIHEELWEAVRAGLVSRLGESYEFAHDRIQEAAYSLIPEASRPAEHLRIGRILVSHLSKEAIEERVFDITSQLNRGVHLITDRREKESLARLNIRAGLKAKASIAYALAESCLALATTLLSEDAWDQCYEETFALYLERSECAYLVGNFAEADEIFNILLEKARQDTDRAKVYRLRLKLYQVAGRYDEGVRVALEALSFFGVTFPEADEEIQAAMEAEMREISESLRGRAIADLFDAPVVSDPKIDAIIGLLVEAMPCAYIGRPKLYPLLNFKAVNFSLRYGNTRESCFAYSAHGLLLVSMFDDIPSAFAFSEMSLRLNQRFDDPRLTGTLLHLHGNHINFWQRPIATDFPILERAFRACLEVGDLVYAGFLAFETVWQMVEKGEPLDEVLEASRKYAAFARESHNDPVYATIRLEQQFVACLQGATREPVSFDDETFDELACLDEISRATFGCGVVFYHIMKQVAAFTYERNDEAFEAANRATQTLGAAMAMPIEATHHFYLALTLTAMLPQASSSDREKLSRMLSASLSKLELWAQNCPENFQNRYVLLSAEVARIEGRELDAMRLYEQAIRLAGENGFVQNEALGCELAARFHLARGFDRIADTYLREARAAYRRWGAEGKVKQIDERHPHLLDESRLAPAATFAAKAEELDLFSVFKASQLISSEIVVDKLLRTLLQVVLEEGGAQRGYLILCHEGGLSIEAEAALEGEEVSTKLLQSQPVESSSFVPGSILHYVKLTGECVILEDASFDAGKFSSDAYFVEKKPRSLVCLPILRQGRVVGMLYLENKLVVGAFTKERLASLELLATQAAISLENALLLRETQEAVRTREEFLSVASHELRTPMTSLSLAVESMRRSVQAGRPLDSSTAIRLLDLISRQTSRMTTLISDLLDVSRMAAGKLPLELEDIDLVSLVRDVVERLEPQLSSARCTVRIEGDASAKGRWDRSRIDQVITNLLSNAMKFGAGKPIELGVREQDGTARMTFRDYGIGIEPRHQARVFDRFERAVSTNYGGLGLGLHISRSIVEAHGGTIRVESRKGAGSTFIVELPCTGALRSGAASR